MYLLVNKFQTKENLKPHVRIGIDWKVFVIFLKSFVKSWEKYASAYLQRIIRITNAISLANVITRMADVPDALTNMTLTFGEN